MTPHGLRILRDELKRLREVERPKNVQDIEIARAHGDLKENAEYHAAKERQSFIEGRLREIEGTIALSEVIDPGKLSGSRVVFGATVRLSDTDTGDEVVYSIVGDHEADIKEGRISISAPLARALIDREHVNEMHWRFIRPQISQFPRFADFVLSYELHLGKPDREIFEVALARAGVVAEAAAFFDDIQAFANAASTLGIHGRVFTTADNFRRQLGELQIVV
jgi:transcription elongation factor GreA